MSVAYFSLCLDAKRVNEQDTLWFNYGPRLMAAYGLLTALGFDGQTQVATLESFIYIHREKTPLGDFKSNRSTFVAQQRRGAFTFEKNDLNSKGQYPGNLSIQPIVESDSKVVLLAKYDVDMSETEVKSRLEYARFSGGRIESYAVRKIEDFEAGLSQVSGFAFLPTPDLVNDLDPVGSMLEAMSRRPISLSHAQELGVEPIESFVSPCVIGYELISPIENKTNVREGFQHAFVEPVSTLGRYISARVASQNPQRFTLAGKWESEVFHLLPNNSDNEFELF